MGAASLISFGGYTFPAGFRVAERRNPSTIDIVDLLGVAGKRITPGLAAEAEIDIQGQVGSDFNAVGTALGTVDTLQTELNTLFAQLESGYQQLSISENPARYLYAQKKDCSLAHEEGFGRWVGWPKITFVAQDPRWLSSTVHTTTLPSGSTSIGNLGSAPTFPVFTVTGPAVNPSFSIAQSGGAMTFQPTVTMGATDTLIVTTDPRSAPYAVQLNGVIRMDLIGTNAFTNTFGSLGAWFPYLTPGTWLATVLLGGSGTCQISWPDAWWL
jgi:hypothetical protein